MTNKEIKMTIKELEAWSLFAAHAAAGILAGRDTKSAHLELGPSWEFVARDAAKIADKLVNQRRKRKKEGVKGND